MCTARIKGFTGYIQKRDKRRQEVADMIFRCPDKIVFWFGAGISAKYGNYPTWSGFLRSLSEKCTNDEKLISDLLSKKYFAMAAELIRDEIQEEIYFNNILESFRSNGCKLPGEFIALGVKNIITTNYDELLEHSFPTCYEKITPEKFTTENFCRDSYKIIKIHGCVSDPNSCIVGASDYTKAYNESFLSYLTILFATYTVVFWGTSLAEKELFLNALRIVQSNSRLRNSEHYLITSMPKIEIVCEDARLSKLGINLIAYDLSDSNHECYDEVLREIYFSTSCEYEKTMLKDVKKYRDNLPNEKSDLFPCRYMLIIAKLARTCFSSDRNKEQFLESFQLIFSRWKKRGISDAEIIRQLEMFHVNPVALWKEMEAAFEGSLKKHSKPKRCLSLYALKRTIENVIPNASQCINAIWSSNGWQEWKNSIMIPEK